MVRNQRPSSNDRNRNVYLAFLPMRQRQDTILVMFDRSRTRVRKKEGIRSHTHSRKICWQEIIGMNKFTKKAGINNPEIAR